MGYDNDSEMVEIDDVYVVKELDRSIIIEYENEEVVIPKSVIGYNSDVQGEDDVGTLVIPRWLARDRDLI